MTNSRLEMIVRLMTAACLFLLTACSEDDATGSHSTLGIDSLAVTADARLFSDAPYNTYGADDRLCVVYYSYGGGHTVTSRSLLRLPPLTDSVSTSALERVDLILSCADTDTSRSVPVLAFLADREWNEDSVTWNNQPSFESDPFDSATMSGGKLVLDVSSLYLTGDSLGYSIMLNTRDGMEQWYYSREADSELRPVVVYGFRTPH